MKTFLFWLLDNVSLGRIAPWILELALKRQPRRVAKKKDTQKTFSGVINHL